MDHKAISLLGASVDNPNYGVRALAASLAKIFATVSPEDEIYFLYGNNRPVPPQKLPFESGERTIHTVNYRMSPGSGLKPQILWILFLALLCRMLPGRLAKKIVDGNPFLRTMASSELVGDIRGGDSFSDIYGIKRLIIGSLPTFVALALKTRFVLFPQTIGPFNSRLASQIGRFIVRKASVVMVRDRKSRRVAADFRKADEEEIILCPDVAFELETSRLDVVESTPPLELGKQGRELFGLNVSGLLYDRGAQFGLGFDYPEFIRNLIDRLLRESNSQIVLIPHSAHFYSRERSHESDSRACYAAWKQVPEEKRSRVHLINEVYDQYQIKYLIGQCDFFAGARMHACIAALSQAVPTVGIAYSRKFEGVFDTIGVSDAVLDARTTNLQDGLDQVIALYRQRETLRKRLQQTVQEARREIYKAFTQVRFPDRSKVEVPTEYREEAELTSA